MASVSSVAVKSSKWVQKVAVIVFLVFSISLNILTTGVRGAEFGVRGWNGLPTLAGALVYMLRLSGDDVFGAVICIG